MKRRNICNFIVTFIVVAGVFVLLFSNILKTPLGNLDELWNYNTARQIMNGLTPYKDISMITTPLLPTVIGIILKFTTDELVVFRIITALSSTVIIFMSYKILELLLKNKLLSAILASFVTYVYYKNFMLDYNFIVLIITLLIEYLELKKLEETKIDEPKSDNYELDKHRSKYKFLDEHRINYKFNFFIGILVGLAICTKQTAGVFVAFGTVVVELLFVRDKEEFKLYIKNTIVRCLGILLPCVVFVGFLIISGAFKDFIDYALLGIKTFSNSIPYTVLIRDGKPIIKILSIILPLFLLTSICVIITHFIRNNSSEVVDRIKVMTVFSTVMLIILYPISDVVHFLVASLPLLIEFLYVVFEYLKSVYQKDETKIKKYIISGVGAFYILFIITIGGFNIYRNVNEYVSSKDITQELAHYKNVIVPEYISSRAKNIKDLINNTDSKVIILDADAVVFNITNDEYYKNYSMFLKGNIGKDGEDGIIENIKQSSNCIYLVKKDGIRLNWQTPMKVIEYVRENLEKQGEVDMCDVYYKR